MSHTSKLAITMLGMGLLATCHQSIFTAPPGSSIDIVANPTFIPANGGVSVITAIVFDATGQPVPDGTVVQYFTNLGRIDEQGRTNDGIAKVNLVSDGRSGTATVFAVIGGGDSPAPPATTTPTTTLAAAPNPRTASISATASIATGTRSNEVTVDIGGVNPERLLLSADPRNIALGAPRFSTLTATVIDVDGNPVANIPVVFTLLKDNPDTYEERLDSRSLPVFTDNNGQARDRVFTSRPVESRPKEFIVTAELALGSVVRSVSVTIGVYQ